MIEQAHLPLCFGAVTRFSQDSERCAKCPSAAPCKEAVTKLIAQMRSELNVEAVMRGHQDLKTRGKRKSPAADQTRPQASETPAVIPTPIETPSAALQANIMSETRAAIGRLVKVGDPVSVRDQLKAGVNPFSKKLVEPWLLAELMLKRAATMPNIVAVFDKAGISSIKTAAYRAAFISLKIADPDNGALRV